ncbi:hypothetical protein LCGC14_1467250 [marine sediment metagenome]|uniref:Uncharacterized protein n=1 Tax=marine sediment metagenome TaxID=412755 RepID=A0A0F9LU22_9ZZZZ
MLEIIGYVAGVLLIIAVIMFGPIITIWALNTLIGSSIPVNLATWFATLWLASLVASSSRSNK